MMATPAAAQVPGWGPYGAYPPEGISVYGIHARLRANGLRPVTQPVQTGRYVVIRAVDPYGTVVRVLFNAHYGNIVSIAPLPPAPIIGERYDHPYGPYASREPYPRYGAPPADLKSEPALGPNAQSTVPAPSETRSAAVTPNRMPLPRPRPAKSAVAAAPPAATPTPAPAPQARAAAVAAKPEPSAPAEPATTGSIGAATNPAPSSAAAESFPPVAPLE
jgi:hypothetical protein